MDESEVMAALDRIRQDFREGDEEAAWYRAVGLWRLVLTAIADGTATDGTRLAQLALTWDDGRYPDATETLAQLREAASEWDVTPSVSKEHEAAAARVVALFQTLDVTLLNGRPLPAPWKRSIRFQEQPKVIQDRAG